MRNIDEVLKMDTNKEIIDEIFNQVYKVDLIKYDKFEGRSIRSEGYYIALPAASKAQLKETHVIFRMFYAIEKLATKIFIGDTNATDMESNKQFARMYTIEALNKYLEGKSNKDVEKALKIYHLDNFKDVLKDSRNASRLCNFLIKSIENKMRDLIRKSNPDAYWDYRSRTYKKNEYKYLDANVEGNDGDLMSQHEVVADESASFYLEQKINFYKYIYINYIENTDLLLDKQREFFKDICDTAIIDGKNIYSAGYSRQLVNKYKKNILKRLQKAIEDDINIEKELDKEGNIVKYYLK